MVPQWGNFLSVFLTFYMFVQVWFIFLVGSLFLRGCCHQEYKFCPVCQVFINKIFTYINFKFCIAKEGKGTDFIDMEEKEKKIMMERGEGTRKGGLDEGGGGVGPTLPPVVGELNVLAIRQLKVMLTEQTLPWHSPPPSHTGTQLLLLQHTRRPHRTLQGGVKETSTNEVASSVFV